MAATKPVSLIGAGKMVVDPGWSARRHEHPLVEMMVISGGRLAIELGGARIEAGPGDVVMYAPGTPHAERAVGGDRCDFAFLLFEGAPSASLPLVHDGDGRVRRLFDWLLEAQSSGYERRGELAGATTVLIACEYDRLCLRHEPGLAEHVREFLRKRLADPLTVEDIARHARMSRAHFIRTYKLATGRTPMQELRALRLDAARDLIMATDLPLKTVAARVGLGDEQHLSHVFQRVLRVAPGYFRRSR